jgi:hypothetical protein
MSQIAAIFVPFTFAMWVPTYTPRPPVPMTPNDTAEFA